MTSKEKGDSVVAEAIAFYARQGKQVLLPFGDKQKYDLVIDTGESLKKIQCKFTSVQKPSGNYEAMLTVKGGNQSFKTATPYKPGDFDLLFVMTADGSMYEIPSSETEKLSASITLGKKYEVYKVV